MKQGISPLLADLVEGWIVFTQHMLHLSDGGCGGVPGCVGVTFKWVKYELIHTLLWTSLLYKNQHSTF